jgi:hypothetical protein
MSVKSVFNGAALKVWIDGFLGSMARKLGGNKGGVVLCW